MSKKIVFMGTSNFAVPILKSLYQNGFPVSAVYTQPPKKSNRGQKINKSPIHVFSETLSYEVRTPVSLKNNFEEKEFFKKLNPDLVIVVAYGLIIPKDILNLSKKGFINVHASQLPKLRGAAPIQRSIMNQDKETGISIMKINENLDEGPLYDIFSTNIKDNENAMDLSIRLANIASEKILNCLEDIFSNKAIFYEQDHNKATYANKINKSEGKILWEQSSKEILGKINGLYPFPGAWFIFKNERYKILKAELSNSKGQPGLILSENFDVGCKDFSIKILEIQREGRKIQNINHFILGSEIKKGTNLNNV
tara:strand:+ start:526 stop:1455 length:930 start_codon:yes stop_codon:yes gene_type:complete